MSLKNRLVRTLKVLLNTEPYQKVNNRSETILNILLEKHGNRVSSEKKSSIDGNQNPIPWFTYPAIEYLNQLDLKEFNVLEWGCGNSTKYFSKKCSHIISIENNLEWYEKIKPALDENCDIYLKDNENEYVNFPSSVNKHFDIIIIDGVYRDGCIDTALSLHSKKGFIIFDNADRNPELCNLLRAKNYLEIDFHGFGPINNYAWTTSLFFQIGSMQNIKPLGNQPLIPLGGGY